jgi:predicted nucleic acid-binding protein
VPVSDVWVLNASPVILLGKIGRLDLLESLSAKAVVPNAVVLEIQAGIGEHQAVQSTADWAALRRAADVPIPLSIERWDLGPGESQVIAHCLKDAQRAVLDDAQGRQCARAHGIAVIGTVGIVLSAKRQGMIPAARLVLETLRRSSMYLSDQVLTEALRLIGE